jgi:hypothetical protein
MALGSPTVKLVMTLLVRDEEDIVRGNIDFHLAQGVDYFIATDNLSVDGTTAILRHYERRGLLHYISQAEDDYSQCRWVTHMARLARTKFGADWIINNDADEFWFPEQGNLKDALAALPASCDAASVPRKNFPPRQAVNKSLFADIMTAHHRHSVNNLGQPLPDKVCHRAFADVEVEQGNHAARRDGRRLKTAAAPISILHFPLRSYAQFANKIMKGGAAYARNRELTSDIGRTWRDLYELWRQGQLERFYQGALVDDQALERGVKEGRLVMDTRLKSALHALRSPAAA